MSDSTVRNFIVGYVGVGYKDLMNELTKRGINTVQLPICHFPRQNIRKIDLLHGFFFHSSWPWFIKAKLLRKKTVCYWIGSDTLLATKNYIRKIQLRFVNLFIDRHVVVSGRLKEELQDVGIKSEVLEFGPKVKIENIEYPEKFSVLAYCVKDAEELYGLDKVLHLANRFPGIEFYIVGMDLPDSEKYEILPNVTYCGYVDMDTIWPKITLLIRMTLHDGYPRMIVEALAKGRYVIHNYPLSGVIYCQNTDQAEEKIITLIDIREKNQDGQKLVEKKLSFDSFVERNLELYEDILR